MVSDVKHIFPLFLSFFLFFIPLLVFFYSFDGKRKPKLRDKHIGDDYEY